MGADSISQRTADQVGLQSYRVVKGRPQTGVWGRQMETGGDLKHGLPGRTNLKILCSCTRANDWKRSGMQIHWEVSSTGINTYSCGN